MKFVYTDVDVRDRAQCCTLGASSMLFGGFAASQSTLSTATAQDWVLSGPGSTCASVCPTSSAVLFRTFSGETARDTALCSATSPSGVQVVGFEEGSGCVANANGTVVTSETYLCRCTEPNQKQGLALPSAEGSCNSACNQVCLASSQALCTDQASSSRHKMPACRSIGFLAISSYHTYVVLMRLQ